MDIGMACPTGSISIQHRDMLVFHMSVMSVLWFPSMRVKVLGHVANLGLCLRCDFGNLELAARRSHEMHLH